MEKRRQILYSLITSLVVTAVIGAGALRRVDRWAQDSMFQQPGATSANIVIIGIDEEALEELGPYQTWDRNVMASALEALAADPSKKPAVTAIDILYAGHTSEQADARLAAAAQELGNVITASMAQFGERITWVDGHATVVNTSAVVGFLQPYEELRACTTQGHINAMSDADGVMRHGLLYVRENSRRRVILRRQAILRRRAHMRREAYRRRRAHLRREAHLRRQAHLRR